MGDVVEAGHLIAQTHSALFEALGPKATHELPDVSEKARRSRATAPKGR